MTNLSGTITNSQTLSVKNSPYLVSGTLKIDKSGSLRIPAGVTVAFGPKGLINNYGVLDVGSNSGRVTLTSNADATNSSKVQKWGGVKTYSGGVSTFNRVTVKYTSKAAFTTSSGSLTLLNSTISDCGSGISVSNSSTSVKTSISIQKNTINVSEEGITLSYLNGTDFTFSGNKITSEKSSIIINLTNYKPTSVSDILSSNTCNNYVELNGTLQQSEMNLPAKTYKMTSNITIPKESTLNIASGAKVCSSLKNLRLDVRGKLNCNGTASSPIIMTSINDPEFEGGNTIILWAGIDATSTGEVSLDYVDLRYISSFAVTADNILDLRNSKISECGSGIKINSSTEGQNVNIYKNSINVTKTGVYISNLNKSVFEFSNNSINSGESSIYINLTNYLPSEYNDILRGNTYDNYIELLGTFQNDFDFPKSNYKLSEAIDIPKDVNVKFAAGSRILAALTGLSVTVQGTLNCVGTSSNPILFTSINDPTIEDGKSITYWAGINSKAYSNLTFDYVQIRYASTPIKSGGEIKLTNSILEESSSYGVYINLDNNDNKGVYLKNNILRKGKKCGIYFYKMNGGNFVFENNNISEYGDISLRYNFTSFKPTTTDEFQLSKNTFDAAVRMDGNISFDLELPKCTYELGSAFGLLSGKRLTILPGAVMKKENSSADTGIGINGILKAKGTEKEKIIFTNYADKMFGTPPSTINRWNGITIGDSGNAILENIDVRKTASAAVNIMGRASLKNSVIQDSSSIGIKISTSTGGNDIIVENNEIKNNKIGLNINKLENANFVFRNNVFSKNKEYDISAKLTYYTPFRVLGGISDNDINGNIEFSGILYSDLILPKKTYEFSYVTIGQGGYMQIEPGSTIKTSGQITVDGTLMAAGKASEHILMTGQTDTKLGDKKDVNWLGIEIRKVGTAYLDFVNIRNTNKSGLSTAAESTIVCRGKLNLTNSSFEDAFAPTVLNFNSDYYPTIKNNSFDGISNAKYAIRNKGSIIIDAKENYWGSSEGPSVESIETSGGKLSNKVSYIPFDAKGGKNSTLRAELSINHNKLYKFGEHEKIVNISVQDGTQESYYVKLLYTWNVPTIPTAVWHKKDEGVINSPGSVDFPFEIYETGTVYLKAVIYDKKDGNIIVETNSAKADISSWYYTAFEDNSEEHFETEDKKHTKNVYTQAYVSLKNNNMSSEQTTLKAYVSQNRFKKDEIGGKTDNQKYAKATWKEYTHTTGEWSYEGKLIPECPVLITPKSDELRFVSKLPIGLDNIAYVKKEDYFEYDGENSIIFATQNYWDKKIYESDIYNNISQQPCMSSDYEAVKFESGGKKYLAAFWKGQYYLSSGGEIGIYMLDSSGEYVPVDGTEGIRVKLALHASGVKLAEKETQGGWLTMYKIGINTPKRSLKLDITINFSDKDMLESLAAALSSLKYTATVNENAISFQLTTPKLKQTYLYKAPDRIWEEVITKLFSIYDEIEIQGEVESKYDIFKDRLPVLSKKLLDIDGNEEIRSRYNEEIPKEDMTYRKNIIPLLYCNYPEHLEDKALKPNENGLYQCLNRFTVSNGPGQIFYSYQGDRLGKEHGEYTFGILATTSNDNATVYIENLSHFSNLIGEKNDYDTDMGILAEKSVADFFYDIDDKNQTEKIKNMRKEYIVTRDKPVWILSENIVGSRYFSGNIRFLTHGSVDFSVYAFEGDGKGIKGTEPLYKYDYNPNSDYKVNFDTTKGVFYDDDLRDYRQYSGKIDSYLLRANPIVAKLSDIADKKSICFETNHRDDMAINVNYNAEASGPQAIYEMLPISIAGTSYMAICTPSDKRKTQENSPLRNLGNWGVEYHLKVAFVNDTKQDSVISYWCDNSIDTQAKYPIIIYDKKYAGESEGPTIESLTIKQEKLKFGKLKLNIPAESIKYFDYVYILGTNSSGGVKHVFEIEP